MEEYKGRCASSGKEKIHEQNHPHPKAQRPAVVCGGAGVRGAVRGTASI
mgnify:CR=1 FL=1